MCPSEGKRWVRPPWEHGVHPVPDEVVDWIEDHRIRRTAKRAKQAEDPAYPAIGLGEKWTIRLDLQVAIALAQDVLHGMGDTESLFYKQEGNGLYFKTCPGRVCPYMKAARRFG